MKNDPSFLKLLHAIAHENSVIQNLAQRTEGNIVEIMDLLENELIN